MLKENERERERMQVIALVLLLLKIREGHHVEEVKSKDTESV